MLAVPARPYADTSGEPGRVRYYAVAAVADGESAGPLSDPVAAAPHLAGDRSVTIGVGGAAGELARPWEPIIGSEHLSCLLRRDRTGGRVIGTELREALRIAHDELGVRAVRAHGILCDDLGVYRESGGSVVHDFSDVDRVYDELMETGLRPVVERPGPDDAVIGGTGVCADDRKRPSGLPGVHDTARPGQHRRLGRRPALADPGVDRGVRSGQR